MNKTKLLKQKRMREAVILVVFIMSIHLSITVHNFWLSIPAILIALYFIYSKRRKYIKESDRNNFYTVGCHCPNCGYFNYTAYLKGNIAVGNKVTCNKCGKKYTHKG